MSKPKFRIPPHRALDDAMDAELEDVVIIGRNEDGVIYIASSLTADDSMELVQEGSAEIEILASDED